MLNYPLDTNAAIAILNDEEGIQDFLVSTNRFSLSIVTVGELFYGAQKSGRREANWQRVEEFISRRVILNCDTITAQLYAQIRFELQRKGRPNQANDIWIAATALQYNLTLLTRDTDFNHVDGLTVQS